MVVAIDASTPAKATGTAATAVSPSFTPPAGSVIVVLFMNNDPAAVDSSATGLTNSGTAITWTRRARKSTNAASTGGAGTNGSAEIWTGTGVGTAITVTATAANGTGLSHEKLLKCMVLTGADTTNLTNVAAAFSTSGLPSVTLTGCSLGSYVIACSNDWQARGLGTVGTGQTMVDENQVAGQTTEHVWRTTATLAAAGSQTMNLTAIAAQQYNIVAIEVPPTGGGGGPAALPQRPRVVQQALNRATVF